MQREKIPSKKMRTRMIVVDGRCMQPAEVLPRRTAGTLFIVAANAGDDPLASAKCQRGRTYSFLRSSTQLGRIGTPSEPYNHQHQVCPINLHLVKSQKIWALSSFPPSPTTVIVIMKFPSILASSLASAALVGSAAEMAELPAVRGLRGTAKLPKVSGASVRSPTVVPIGFFSNQLFR